MNALAAREPLMVEFDARPQPVYEPKPFGLPCPHCRLRSMVPKGGRIYICENPDCRGDVRERAASHVSMLTLDPVHGPQLRPWEEVTVRDRIRKSDPRGFLRQVGVLS